MAPDAPLYTESLTIRRTGPLDPVAFGESYGEVVLRHEIWRTTFQWSDGQVIQQVLPHHKPGLRYADLRRLPERDREPLALNLAAEDLRTPFDLSWEPGVRAWLVTLSDHDHRLFLCLHHLVFDGISIYRVFLPELVALYEAKVSGVPCVLGEPPLQYADFALWQRQRTDETALAPLIAYWRRRLAGAPALIDLPTDHPRPARQSFRAGLVRFEFPVELAAGARRLARTESCTIFMVLLASFAATLYRWSGQTDLLIGSVSGGRDRPELERVVGYFLRMLAIRADLRGDPTFRELLVRVREALIDALCHDAIPFQRLIQALAPVRDPGRSPLFQVTLSIEPPMPPLGPDWDITEMDAGPVASKFDLSVELEDRGDIITGRAIYSVDLFEADTIARLVEDWRRLLDRAVADCSQPLANLVGSGPVEVGPVR